MNTLDVYEGSDPQKTKALYARLEACGPIGLVARELFRAQKASARAKVYHGGVSGVASYKSLAYQKKAQSLQSLVQILMKHDCEARIPWGR